MPGLEPHVKEIDWRIGFSRSLGALKFASDDTDHSAAIWKVNHWDRRFRQRLIARLRHLERLGQVDPQLHHLKNPAALGEVGFMHLFMYDTRCRAHPLHVARTECAVIA